MSKPLPGTQEYEARREALGMNDKIKLSNPKDAIGSMTKVGMSTVSNPVMYEVALGMLEGALKYGRHNYRRIGVRASVYYDATKRHLDSWWEGEDFDPDSKANLHHVTKAIASLTVLRDAMISDKFHDDRPPKAPKDWMQRANDQAKALIALLPNPKPPYTEKGE